MQNLRLAIPTLPKAKQKTERFGTFSNAGPSADEVGDQTFPQQNLKWWASPRQPWSIPNAN